MDEVEKKYLDGNKYSVKKASRDVKQTRDREEAVQCSVLRVTAAGCGVTEATLVTSCTWDTWPRGQGTSRVSGVVCVCIQKVCGSCILCSVTGSGVVQDHCGTHLYYHRTLVLSRTPGPRPSPTAPPTLVHHHPNASHVFCISKVWMIKLHYKYHITASSYF